MAKRRDDHDGQLRREAQLAAQALRDAYEKFDYVSEPELIEACVYEIKALKARYSYLLRCIKEEEGAYIAAGAMRGGDVCRS